MRICRIARIYPRSTFPGSGLVAYKLSELLEFPCLYIAKKFPGKAITFPKHVKAIFVDYPEPNFPDGSNITKLYLLWLGIGKAFGNLVLIAKTIIPILRFHPDILHLHTPLQIALGITVKLIYRCPLVLTFHGTDYNHFQRSKILQTIVRKFVDHIICISPNMFDDVVDRLPMVSATYVENGVDLDLFAPKLTDNKRKKQIVAVGRLVWQKDYECLIEAARDVLAKHPDYRFVIIGEGNLRNYLETLIKDDKLEEKICLVGNIPQEKVVKYLQQSKIYAMSSVTEGFPKALIEAMACGLPIVTTNVGACQSVAQNSGFVVPAKRPKLMSNAINELIEKPFLCEQYGKTAVNEAQKYDWQSRSKKVNNIYGKVLTRLSASEG